MGNQRNKRSLQTPNYPMTYLPDEITMIILSNLPVKSLLRFKCVSKSWRSWISSPKFNLGNQRRQGAIAMMISKKYSAKTSSLIRFTNQQLTLEELYAPFMIRDDMSYRGTFRLLGSCHGLILISITKSIYLWNPATRFYTKVFELDDLNLDRYYTVGGLCFDSSKNVYKAVLIMHQTLDGDDKFVRVASLEDKKWRQFEFPYDIFSVCDGITLHGRIHHRVRVSHEDDNSEYKWNCFGFRDEIIYFDPITEKFHVFSVPDPKSHKVENVIISLGALNECLCMTRLDDHKRGIEILVMKEYGVKESWTSLFFIKNLEIDPRYGALEPLLMTENGELIFRKNTVYVLVYDPKNDNMQDIQPIKGTKEYISCIICYVESLISPKELLLELG